MKNTIAPVTCILTLCSASIIFSTNQLIQKRLDDNNQNKIEYQSVLNIRHRSLAGVNEDSYNDFTYKNLSNRVLDPALRESIDHGNRLLRQHEYEVHDLDHEPRPRRSCCSAVSKLVRRLVSLFS